MLTTQEKIDIDTDIKRRTDEDESAGGTVLPYLISLGLNTNISEFGIDITELDIHHVLYLLLGLDNNPNHGDIKVYKDLHLLSKIMASYLSIGLRNDPAEVSRIIDKCYKSDIVRISVEYSSGAKSVLFSNTKQLTPVEIKPEENPTFARYLSNIPDNFDELRSLDVDIDSYTINEIRDHPKVFQLMPLFWLKTSPLEPTKYPRMDIGTTLAIISTVGNTPTIKMLDLVIGPLDEYIKRGFGDK